MKFPEPTASDEFWEAEAEKLEDPVAVPHVPLAVLAQEVRTVARFCQRYREPQQRIDGVSLPGLTQIGDEEGLPPNVSEQLLELLHAYELAHTRYRVLVEPEPPDAETVKEGQVGGCEPGPWPEPPPDQDPELALRMRNRLAHLIEVKMRAVRTAARYVFRDHPDVLREVTSAYGRKRQAKWRARQKLKASEGK